MKRIAATLMMSLLIGCGGGQANNEDPDFFTSGNREADQRAEQRMAKEEQMKPKEQKSTDRPSEQANAADTKKVSLYERLGGDKGLNAIVDDWVARALADPRVNWERKGVTRGGVSLSRNKSVQWDPNQQNVAKLKKHIVEFLAVATGGPTQYGGREMKEAHAGLHISNAEFDASVGALKASLDKLQVPNPEQKEVLAIIESTRPQVAEER
jgi:hemoglobin